MIAPVVNIFESVKKSDTKTRINTTMLNRGGEDILLLNVSKLPPPYITAVTLPYFA